MTTQILPESFVRTLEHYFVTKAPFQIPANIKEFIVKYGPWLMVVLLVVMIPGILVLIGLSGLGVTFGTIYSPAYMASGWSFYAIFALVAFVLNLLALPGLFKRKLSGWNLIFYSTLVSFLGSILMMNIIGGLISVIISLYILFQIRSYYS